jgi:hypothetical protein
VQQVALTSSAPTTADDTVEFPVLADPPRLVTPLGVERAVLAPFRSRAADLVALFDTAEAQTPWWHRERARALRRDANAQTVAAVTGAYRRLAARHDATAQLLEDDGPHWAVSG